MFVPSAKRGFEIVSQRKKETGEKKRSSLLAKCFWRHHTGYGSVQIWMVFYSSCFFFLFFVLTCKKGMVFTTAVQELFLITLTKKEKENLGGGNSQSLRRQHSIILPRKKENISREIFIKRFATDIDVLRWHYAGEVENNKLKPESHLPTPRQEPSWGARDH